MAGNRFSRQRFFDSYSSGKHLSFDIFPYNNRCFILLFSIKKKKKGERLMEKLFKLKANGTTFSKEIIAGLTTFFTMAYIIAVNPSILSQAGMEWGAVFLATIIAAVIGTLFMGLFANSSVRSGPRHGPERILRLYGMFRVGLLMAACAVACFYLRPSQYFHNRNQNPETYH
jgi:hypothetical protein